MWRVALNFRLREVWGPGPVLLCSSLLLLFGKPSYLESILRFRRVVIISAFRLTVVGVHCQSIFSGKIFARLRCYDRRVIHSFLPGPKWLHGASLRPRGAEVGSYQQLQDLSCGPFSLHHIPFSFSISSLLRIVQLSNPELLNSLYYLLLIQCSISSPSPSLLNTSS